MNENVYWWDSAPPRTLETKPVISKCDIVVIGGGYTGLSAAITLARAGRSVQIFDRLRPGAGASTRNGGITSGNLRESLSQMTRRFGAERAAALVAEAHAARENLYQFIEHEGIDCDFRLTGRFTGAATPQDYDVLARDAELLQRTLGIDSYAVPRSEQHKFIGSDFYHGGSVRMDMGGLHPAKLHSEMLRIALAAGATVHGETRVTGIRRAGDGYEVGTVRGKVWATQVISAVNGYADESDTWLRRRLVPVRSRIIATEPLSKGLIDRLMPHWMMYSETRRLHYYYRPSPDGKCILFGGRDGTIAGNPEWPVANLSRRLAEIFPDLDGVGVSHSWFGNVAMNRDMIPRIFNRHGVQYAAGFCGSGVVWARWAGQKVAFQILGESAGKSALDFRPPKLVPAYAGTPWFMPVIFGWLSTKDRLAQYLARR